jgi:4-alpha-glucanotransferase
VKVDDPSQALRELARAAGIEHAYRGWDGQPVVASARALRAALAALGVHVEDAAREHDAQVALERAHWREVVPPVLVAWSERAGSGAGAGSGTGTDTGPKRGLWVDVPLRVPADLDVPCELELTTEGGAVARVTGRLFQASAHGHAWPAALDGHCHCIRRARIEVPGGELGYHTLRWQVGVMPGVATVIAAPVRAWGAPGDVPRRWGVFAPLYAARRAERGAVGDLEGLTALLRRVRADGGHYVATLPLLAGFLDEPCHPSPYSPASRLYWNELYLAPAGASAGAVGEDEVAAARARFAQGAPIQYRDEYRARRARIDREAQAAWAAEATRGELIAAAEQGGLLDYAMFRALGEAEATTWPSWPAPWRDPPPAVSRWDALPAGVDVARVQSHVYAQWQMQRQLAALAAAGGDDGGLYLDLPVGVNADAYELWRRRDQFLVGLSAGAPPDALFLGGQDWGLPPVSPYASREDGHRYLRACARHHMSCARMLRVDHVMGLHRLYCVPRGFSAREGVYLRYPAEELYAILTLESHRHRCALVGEDLGTVPDEVRPMMRRHGLASLFVGEFAMPAARGQAPGAPAAEQVASLNTHDTPTFAGWWHGHDIDDRRALGLITDAVVERERVERAASRAALLAWARASTGAAATGAAPATVAADDRAAAAEAMVAHTRALAASAAHVVLVNVEDLWLEPAPQNVPGTSDERPNWRRPWARALDDVLADGAIAAELVAVADRRR